MGRTARPLVVLLAATLLLVPAAAEAKKHGHHAHVGWLAVPFVRVRSWFRHASHETSAPRHRRMAAHRSRQPAVSRTVDDVVVAQRRRSEVDAYLHDHPALAAAE